MLDKFMRGFIGFRNSDAERNGITVAQRKKMANRAPSFTDMLPYISYEADEKFFRLRDGSTIGAFFELTPIPTEAQKDEFLEEYVQKVQESLQAIPQSEASPWIVQFFVNDDRNLDWMNQTFRDYILDQHKAEPERAQAILNSPYTQAVLSEIQTHLENVSQPDGLFHDTQVTGQIWRGQVRRVRCCIYKRFTSSAMEESQTPEHHLTTTADTVMATLQEAGVGVKRCTGKDLYEWLLPFFNRKVPWAPDTNELLQKLPYPGDKSEVDSSGAPLFGYDLSELLNINEPRSDAQRGLFEFDGIPVKAMTLQNLRRTPSIGHFTAERNNGEKERFARFDRLPPGSMLSITVTIQPQHVVERHIEQTRDTSRAKNAYAMETYRECSNVLHEIVRGNHLYPVQVTLYATANNLEELDSNINAINALLVPSGLKFIDSKHDLVALDSFMRGLPFNFDPAFDQKSMRRSRLTFASQIARLLPVFGRARGTPHPGMWFWNRGGEPLFIDPLNKYDRKKNAHMLVIGPTGAGKSATLNYLSMLTMAIHRPRLVIVDAGKSFGLLLDYFKFMGLTTHSVELTSNNDVSLPPFVHALKLLDDKEIMGSFYASQRAGLHNTVQTEGLLNTDGLDSLIGDDSDTGAQAEGEDADSSELDEADDAELSKRDLMGEMMIAAIMMITGGEPNETAKMSRSDRYLISTALIRAALKCKAEGRKHPVTHDVSIELITMGKDPEMPEQNRNRCLDMGQAMDEFCRGLRGNLFNREGTDWPDVDVTLVEMGTLTQDGYGDALAVAYTSLIDSVQSRGEAKQHEGRPLIFLTDEGHLITTNELLGPKVAKGTKMWRKLNMWFWLATQNLQDFPDSMERVLSMCEFWMLLTMDKAEINQVVRFRSLTEEQRSMMESARKEPQKYTEGVLINAMGQFLFRNVPPALPIALAMTEGYEKADRRRLMQKHGINEMEAAQMVAREIARKRG